MAMQLYGGMAMEDLLYDDGVQREGHATLHLQFSFAIRLNSGA